MGTYFDINGTAMIYINDKIIRNTKTKKEADHKINKACQKIKETFKANDDARVSGCVILKGNEAIRNHAVITKASDIFHTTINDESITYTKNNDNWHTKIFDGSTEEFLASAKTAEQKRLYKLLIALAKEGTNPC